MNRTSVQCRNISFSYGESQVLNDVSLDIESGEFFALLGPSGCGKSTLLRAIAGFVQPQAGQILIGPKDVTEDPSWKRSVGMVFQNYALWPHLNVWDNVAFGLVERKVSKTVTRDKVAATLEMLELSRFAQRRTNELSGGQQQRVALARTLAVEPQVLLLDEPLSNLDRVLRVQMRRELLALQRRLGITTIFVTHDQEEAMTTADRVAVLNAGVIEQVGAPVTVYDYPVNKFVAGFVGTANTLHGTVKARTGKSLTLDVPSIGQMVFPVHNELPESSRFVVSFRPQTLRMEIADGVQDPRFLWLLGMVAAHEFVGQYSRYHVQVGSYRIAVEQPHFTGLSKFPTGCGVSIGLDRSQVRLFAE